MKFPSCILLAGLAGLAVASASAGAVRLTAHAPTADSVGTRAPLSGDLSNSLLPPAADLTTFHAGSADLAPAARHVDSFGGVAVGPSNGSFAAVDGQETDGPAASAASTGRIYALLFAGLAGVAFISSRRFN